MSSWSAHAAGADAARAVQAARAAPGQIATLILPADTAWDEAQDVADPFPVSGPAPASKDAISHVATLLATSAKMAILLCGPALRREGLEAAGRIAAATGCRLLCDTFAPRLDRGAGLTPVERIPYFAEQMVKFLTDVEVLVLVGAKPPVTFFAYPGKPSWTLPAGCEIRVLTHAHEDGVDALHRLAERINTSKPSGRAPCLIPDEPRGTLSAATIGQVIARHLQEWAIISDDGATSRQGTLAATAGCPTHTHLALASGAIGQGLPLAIGAAVACPDLKVVCLTGDGSAMYTLQALWTMARENLDVTTIVFSNRSYLILNVEFGRVGAGAPGEMARDLLDLNKPDLQWMSLAAGMGVEASRAQTIDAFTPQFRSAMASPGPRLIEAVL